MLEIKRANYCVVYQKNQLRAMALLITKDKSRQRRGWLLILTLRAILGVFFVFPYAHHNPL